MNFILGGFKQGEGVRRYAFTWVAADGSRGSVIVGADIGLARKHEIRLQELPLLCRQLLETVGEDGFGAPLTMTENHMIGIQEAARDASAKKPAKQRRVHLNH